MDNSLPENHAATLANKVLHGLIFSIGLEAAKAAAIAEAPWLKLPIVSQIFNLLLNKIGEYIYIALSDYIDFQIIDFQSEQKAKEYEEAKQGLQNAIQDHTQNLDEARQKFKDALRNAVRFGGIAIK